MDRIGRIIALAVLAVALGLFGWIAASSGFKGFAQWGAVSTGLKAVYVLSLACGIMMLFSALALLVSRGRKRFPAWSGSAASTLLGIGVIAGVLTYVIPCSGPS